MKSLCSVKSLPPPPEPLFVMKADMKSVHCLLFANFNDKEHLYIGTADGTVHIWDLQTNRKKKTLKQSDSPCLSLHVINEYLLTQDKSSLVQLWFYKNEDFTCLYSRSFHNLSFCKIDVLKKGDFFYAAVPQPESKVNVYSIVKHNLEFNVSLKHSEPQNKKLGDILALKMTVINDVMFVATMYESGVLIFWNISTKEVMTQDHLTDDTPMCFDFDPENLQGVCGTSGKSIVIFKIHLSEMNVMKKKHVMITNPGVGSLRIRPDKKILAAGCWDGKVRIFSWKNLKLLAILESHYDTVLDVSFSSKTSNSNCEFLLASGSSDKKVCLWNIYND